MKRIQRLFSIALIVAVLVLVCFAAVLFFGKMDKKVEGFGTVSPGRQIGVAPRINGIIERTYVSEGERVSSNDTLFTIYSEEIEMEVKRSRNMLADARADLTIAEDEYRNLETSRSYELGVILADLNEAEQRMNFYSENLERMRKLYEKELVNAEEFERERLSYESSKSYYEVLKARSEIIKKQLGWRIEERRRNLELAESAFELAQGRLDKTVVCAPVNGIVLTAEPERLVGTLAGRGEPTMQIGCFDEFVFMVNIDEAYITDIHLGQETKIFLNSYPHREYKVFKGTVEKIASAPAVSQGSSVFEVKVLMEDPWIEDEDGGTIPLKCGLLGKAEIIVKPSVRLYKILLDSFSR
jgi:multidrug resistance efflux pump